LFDGNGSAGLGIVDSLIDGGEGGLVFFIENWGILLEIRLFGLGHYPMLVLASGKRNRTAGCSLARGRRSKRGSSYYRARYYDPNAARFMTEDPVRFDAGPNFYRYVRNNPVVFVDPTGLQIGTLPPDPSQNTIVCNGHGGIGIQIVPATLGKTPKDIQCVIDCARLHEQIHMGDALAGNPKVCKGQAKGVIVGFDPKTKRASEIKASDAEIDCLWNAYHKGCKDCKQTILDRIGDVEGYRDFYKNKP
jgi:RHS repeat-associated protein